MVLLLLGVAALLNSCTLVNRDQANDPPVLDVTRIDHVRVKRGDPVRVEVVATDEDYDPLFFVWESYRLEPSVLDAVLALDPAGHLESAEQLRSFQGFIQLGEPVGGFTDSLAQMTNSWYAPRTIHGDSERFLLAVAVRDRDCGAITDFAEQTRCATGESQFVQVYAVEVTQRAPRITVAADTLVVPFQQPAFELSAHLADADGDPLQVVWQQTAGPEIPFSAETTQQESQLRAVPFFVGDYAFQIQVSDAADTVYAQILVRVVADPLPAGDMVSLTLPDGSTYAMDRYEFPNQPGVRPLLTDSWFAAARACDEVGKRLCTRREWTHACGGSDGGAYSSIDAPPVGDDADFGYRFCNTVGSASAQQAPSAAESLAPSGAYPNCFSEYQIYDLTGNAREWVGALDTQGNMVGGISENGVQDAPAADCATFAEFQPLPTGFDYLAPDAAATLGSEDGQEYLQYSVGFRCCR